MAQFGEQGQGTRAADANRLRIANDVKAQLRLATLWNVPVATNLATADMIISSPLMTSSYVPSRPTMDRPSTGAEYIASSIA